MPEKSERLDKRSWLSPRRRRTTGNLKTISKTSNGHTIAEEQPDEPVTPTRPERPPPSPRPLSQPNVPTNTGQDSDGNLFYAYARRGDDLRSRYLLTFASASIANEWWLLAQAHFPDCTRPGAQLFSFETEDLLSNAWKHPGFEHLKSKWMYISFSDTASENIGGAAQGIIPVQDLQGNMLGGSSPASPELGKARQEVRGMRNEISRLEEYFEKMMEAVERNTEGVRRLAEEKEQDRAAREAGRGVAYHFDMNELSRHFGRVTELLERNSKQVDTLSKRQAENEEKFRMALEGVNDNQRAGGLDTSKLSDHLDRLQGTIEHLLSERKDSARSSEEKAPTIDFTPLTWKLVKVQESIEQNSALMQRLLGGSDENSKSPFHTEPADLSPLTEQLEAMHSAIEQQNSNMQALLEEQKATREAVERNGGEIDFTPLADHMEAVREAVEGIPQNLDLSPLIDHLEAIRESSDRNTEHVQSLVETQQGYASLTASAGQDLTPLTDRLNRIHEVLEKAHSHPRDESPGAGDPKFVLSALSSHLSKIQSMTEQNAGAVKSLAANSAAPNSKQQRLDVESVDKRLEATNSQVRELMASQREMTTVVRELAQAITAQNKGSCDHVVIPPPRKVGRKIVGFVYDAKEGAV